MTQKQVKYAITSGDEEITSTNWGSIQWLVCARNNSSQNMTFGRVTINTGESNPPHFHPNCEEILYVVSGLIEHTLPEGGKTTLHPGDCIVIPRGVVHNARNVGTKIAEVIVAFDNANRETIMV